MATNTIVTLQNLHCFSENGETDGVTGPGSDPYIWPALLWITDSALVEVVAPDVTYARMVIQNGMHAGQSADIPASVSTLAFEFEDNQKPVVLILAIALWQKYDTPDDALNAGYAAFSSGLQVAISDNLLQLNSTDETEQKAAIAAVKKSVKEKVTTAIKGGLSTWEEVEILLGVLDVDAIIDDSSTVFRHLVAAPFTVAIGGTLKDQLLLYHDTTQDGTGDVNTPATLGTGRWAHYKFVFSGGNGIIYAVDQAGRLLFSRDSIDNGSETVSKPTVIGLGGWEEFKFLFSGGNGIIYAVNQAGQLLFYRDFHQDGTGDVDTPSVIGLGGWADFKFLFSGGNGIIYAVDQAGRLLFYRDFHQDGTGDVDTPSVIGLGGWADFQFLFSGGNGIIYAVDQAGRLLFYRDFHQDGTGDVDTPSVIGLGGWEAFTFLFAGGNGAIYAALPDATPKDYYDINGTLDFQAVACATERDNYNQANTALQAVKQELTDLEEELAVATATERAVLNQEINELKKDQLAPAEAALAEAQQALDACLARGGPS